MMKSDELKEKIEAVVMEKKKAETEMAKHRHLYGVVNEYIVMADILLKDLNKELKQALKEEAPQEEILIKKIASIEQLLVQNNYSIEKQNRCFSNASLNAIRSWNKLQDKRKQRSQLEKSLEETIKELNQLRNEVTDDQE